ncbi:MAG: glucose-6-phosphate isomerase, partial [Bacteroidota bacterium]
MLPKVNPTTTKSWKNLSKFLEEPRDRILELFKKNAQRTEDYSLDIKDIHFDFSKNDLSDEVLHELLNLAEECHLKSAIAAQFAGEKINETENRSVLHTELRRLSEKTTYSEVVQSQLDKMKDFERKLTSGEWKGFTNKKITDIVNIGIGGSDLGPKMVSNALKPYWGSVTPHFVSNVDAQQLVETLEDLDAESTLFIIASKTFTTQETMTNAETAKSWFLKSGGTESHIAQHFVAVSTNEEAVKAFGIDTDNMFLFWDWVGGRYSLWSTIVLSISCAIGHENFLQLLAGAEEMDRHFKDTEFKNNIPVIAALIGIWYNNFLGYDSLAVLPYDHRLRFLSSYLQQADMESNGKYIDRSGAKTDYQTGPIIWGEPGTNGQHAFYQLIHQGTKIIPCDFIACAKAAHNHEDHHNKLLANFFAQTEALLHGKTETQVREELIGKSEEDIEKLTPYKIFTGNRPSTSILLKELTPFNLGMLIA